MKKVKKSRVPKTRAGGTMTESAYWAKLRSCLRRGFRFWKPMVDAKHAARRPNQSDNPRLRWEFLCAECGGWFPDKQVEVHHKVPCGSLKRYEDLPGFVERLTAEDVNSYQVVCRPCHLKLHKCVD